MSYLSFSEFKVRSLMGAAQIDRLEGKLPGFVASSLVDESAYIDARLRKRYAAPFQAPYPPVVLRWLNQLVTLKSMMALGFNPQSPQDSLAKEQHDIAVAELKEAADSKDGLFDLPLRADTTATGVSKGGPRGYSEESPYTNLDRQRARLRNE